jgi:uncharacterized coiled-coil protein SlyX
MATEDRLSRIENKLDKLTEAILTIARVEEKVLASNERIQKIEDRVEKQEQSIGELISKVAVHTKQVSFFERALWFCLATLASFATYYIKVSN